jgi:hypothetical protein
LRRKSSNKQRSRYYRIWKNASWNTIFDQFQKEPYKPWYDENYNIYPTDKPTISELKKAKINSYNITVFLGTWCGDSHKNFPRLMKILDETKFRK